MKFKNYEDYKSQRNGLIKEAEEYLNSGKMEEYSGKTKEVEELDNAWEEFAREKANIEALKEKATAQNVIPINGEMVSMYANEDKEYRKAFMNYVIGGATVPAGFSNSDSTTTTSDVGAVIPNTILEKIVEKMESVGGVYGKMTKTFFKGGVSVPTSTAKPVATWTTERGKTDKQNKPVGSITFTYHKLRCVVATSLTVDNVTLDVFERVLAQNIAEAMTKAIEEAAFSGTGATNNQPEGILKTAIPDGQIIEITEGENITYLDLCKCEGALQEANDAGTEWYMRKKTFFEQIQAMTDKNGQPIAKVNYGTAGKPEYYILGRKVNFVDYVPAFESTVSEDRIVAVMYKFEDYLFNTNLQIAIKEYEDHDTDDQIKKAVMLADGKPVDINSLIILKIKNS